MDMRINQKILEYTYNVYYSSKYFTLTKKEDPIRFKKIKSIFKRINDNDKITYFRFCYGNCKGMLTIFRDGRCYCLEEFKLYTSNCTHKQVSDIIWI